MRITSGKYKGREIKTPRGIRPTQDKVRKTLFDILGDIEGLSFLELFAGSGAIGLEALSRGVVGLTMVEYNRDCLFCIKKNAESLKIKDFNLYPKEVNRAIVDFFRKGKKFDIIFLDPPYHKKGPVPRLGSTTLTTSRSGLAATNDSDSPVPRLGSTTLTTSRSGLAATNTGDSLAKKTLQSLGAYDILADYGFIVIEHFKKDELPEAAGGLALFKRAKSADTLLSFYRRQERRGDKGA